MAVALVPVDRRSRRHLWAHLLSPRSRNPRVAALIVTAIAIEKEGADLRPASPIKPKGAVGLLLPPASRTRRPGQGMGQAHLAEGQGAVKDHSDKALDQVLVQGGRDRSGRSVRRPHAGRLDLPDQARRRRPCPKKP